MKPISRHLCHLSLIAVWLCLSASATAQNRTPAIGTGSGAQPAHLPGAPDFAGVQPSPDAEAVASWVLSVADHSQLPFAIIDKRAARVFVFDGRGRLRGDAPVLLGLAVGDEDVPGIGSLPLSQITPEMRITPAGRFRVQIGRNLKGEDILWVDYDSALSLHRVATGNPREARQQRLDSPTVDDNRISFGCINVPARFFDEVVRSQFAGTNGTVYILPETRPVSELFGPQAQVAR